MNTITKHKIAYALADLGELLDYPTDKLKTKVSEWRRSHSSVLPSAGSHIADFAERIDDYSTPYLEELYTRTFDVAPSCTPYITAYIYGDENYERGNLMHKLTERYKECGFEIGTEMPDHIRVLVQFAPYCSLEELGELAEFCLNKPVGEMRDSLQRTDNPYVSVMRCLLDLLQRI